VIAQVPGLMLILVASQVIFIHWYRRSSRNIRKMLSCSVPAWSCHYFSSKRKILSFFPLVEMPCGVWTHIVTMLFFFENAGELRFIVLERWSQCCLIVFFSTAKGWLGTAHGITSLWAWLGGGISNTWILHWCWFCWQHCKVHKSQLPTQSFHPVCVELT